MTGKCVFPMWLTLAELLNSGTFVHQGAHPTFAQSALHLGYFLTPR